MNVPFLKLSDYSGEKTHGDKKPHNRPTQEVPVGPPVLHERLGPASGSPGAVMTQSAGLGAPAQAQGGGVPHLGLGSWGLQRPRAVQGGQAWGPTVQWLRWAQGLPLQPRLHGHL